MSVSLTRSIIHHKHLFACPPEKEEEVKVSLCAKLQPDLTDSIYKVLKYYTD